MKEEAKRLLDYKKRRANWKNWGPYLSERSWGTIREESAIEREGESSSWSTPSFDQAHCTAFQFGEDGIGGICDRNQFIALGFAFWNTKDPILKERLFGLSNAEGNHGEDVKELYYYLDATPTSSYLKMLYKYPQSLFPYEELRRENKKRSLEEKEFEILDTHVFKEDRYFDITIEYAKADQEDLLCKITIENRSSDPASLIFLPTIWFRNTWSIHSGNTSEPKEKKGELKLKGDKISLSHPLLKERFFFTSEASGKGAHLAEWIFCENESNSLYPKDAFHRYIIQGDLSSVNPQKEGTKGAYLCNWNLKPKEQRSLFCRLSNKNLVEPFKEANRLFAKRKKEADDFYDQILKPSLSSELKKIQRQAFAGLLFSKQFYYFDQIEWERKNPQKSRNQGWEHLTTFDLISVPDKWEYPYLCSWDLAFHSISMVLIDPDFAKRQMVLLTREWYMHPNGQIPAYEWAFGDVNPPIHAWALWRIYKIDARFCKKEDRPFLEGGFHKLLINFTWWVNRKDVEGRNVFQGGFLGMDNISVFDRSRKLPTGGYIDQSDGSAWMSFYCIMMMKMALHLAKEEPIYQDSATKFFEHFLRIASAMTACGGREKRTSLWDEQDGFFYDLLHLPDSSIHTLRVRSLVGLIPLLAVETVEPELLEKMPVFKRRMEWFIEKRPEVSCSLACLYRGGTNGRLLLSIVDKDHLIKIFSYLFDEEEFLSKYGIRSLSKFHEKHPFIFHADGQKYQVQYVPGESDNQMFGGNSNWRGPIWMPINFLIIEALQRFHHYYGDTLRLEFPTRSGNFLNLKEISIELSLRLMRLFVSNEEGKIPLHGKEKIHEHPLFYEYFHPETGKGLGASHQTGWTALIAKLIQQSGDFL